MSEEQVRAVEQDDDLAAGDKAAVLAAMGVEECTLIAPGICADFLRTVRHIAVRIDEDRLPIALAECMSVLARFAVGEDQSHDPMFAAQAVHIEGDVEVASNAPTASNNNGASS